MLDYLRGQRRRFEAVLAERDLGHTFSLARYRLRADLGRLLERHARGECLDIGSGRSPYKRQLVARGCSVVSVDVERRSPEVDLIADAQDLQPLADESFDTVLCTQVLEHMPRPWDAVREISRVLRPGGAAILSGPHLSVVHEAPHDYYRYTRYGFASLCDGAGLELLEISPTGGLLCFLGHGASALLMGTIGALPGLRWPVWALNYLLLVRLLDLLDRVGGLATVYPCDHVLAARKPARGNRQPSAAGS